MFVANTLVYCWLKNPIFLLPLSLSLSSNTRSIFIVKSSSKIWNKFTPKNTFMFFCINVKSCYDFATPCYDFLRMGSVNSSPKSCDDFGRILTSNFVSLSTCNTMLCSKIIFHAKQGQEQLDMIMI